MIRPSFIYMSVAKEKGTETREREREREINRQAEVGIKKTVNESERESFKMSQTSVLRTNKAKTRLTNYKMRSDSHLSILQMLV